MIFTADKVFLQKQNDLLQLFVNVRQLNYNQQQKEIGDSFDLEKQQHEFLVSVFIFQAIYFKKDKPIFDFQDALIS